MAKRVGAIAPLVKAVKAAAESAKTATTQVNELAKTIAIELRKVVNTVKTVFKGASASAAGAQGVVPAPAAGDQAKFLKGDGTWGTPPNTTYTNMTGATAQAAGTAGLVPAPAAGKQASFLRGDGTWNVPPSTDNTKIPKAGNAGTLTTYEALANATTVSDSSARSMNLASGGSLTVSNGTAGKAWITVVALNGSATITLGSSWAWSGSSPTLAKGLVTLAWYGTFGVANFQKFGA